jgi:hypothetical protein
VNAQPRLAYFDCASGATPEMFLGALVDAELLEADLRDVVAPLGRAGAAFALSIASAAKGPVAGIQVRIGEQLPNVDARLEDMLSLIASAQLPADVARRATAILRRTAEAEARVAGRRVEELVYGGTSGVDAVVGVVGVVGSLAVLGVAEVFASPVNVGRPDAAVSLLLAQAPTYEDSPGVPLVTPPAAGILAELVSEWPASPPFAGGSVGHGAGARDLPRPNVMRCFLGYGTIPAATQPAPSFE